MPDPLYFLLLVWIVTPFALVWGVSRLYQFRERRKKHEYAASHFHQTERFRRDFY